MELVRKVFGIGFHKTATTSVAAALYILGFNVTGYFGVHDPNIRKTVYDIAYDLASRFDAAQDMPWAVIYKELDKKFPGSKFILTVRPSDEWIKSIVNHFKDYYIPGHEWIYGVRSAKGNEEIYIRRYEAHNCEVLEYFKGRPNDLLVMDITKGDGWEKLCPFLNKEIPPIAFPIQNTAKEKTSQIIHRSIRFMKRKLSKPNKYRADNQTIQGVSSAFIRDIVHFHYATFSEIMDRISLLSEAQFEQDFPGSQGSIREHLLSQIKEEQTWLNRLKGETDLQEQDLYPSNIRTKIAVYQLWKHTQLFMREFAANLTDEACDSRVPGSKEYVWEVFVHLMNYGTEQRTHLRHLLRELDVTIEDQSFIQFFR